MVANDGRKSVPYIVRWRKAFRNAGLDVYCVAVGMTLATYADQNGIVGPPSPSLRTLAQNCGIVPNTALKAVDGLEDAGWVETTRQKRHYINYRLTFGVSPEETDEVLRFDDSCLTGQDTVEGPVSHDQSPVYHGDVSVSQQKRHGVSSEPYREEVRREEVREEVNKTQEPAASLRSGAPLRRSLEKTRPKTKSAAKEKTITGPDGKTYRVKP